MTLMMELKQQRREGYNEGKETERLNTIRNLMATLNLTAQQAMDAMKIPVAEQARYAALL